MRDIFRNHHYVMPKTEDIAKAVASKLTRIIHLKGMRKLSSAQLIELKQLVKETHELQQKEQ